VTGNSPPTPRRSPRHRLGWAKASLALATMIAIGVGFPAAAHALSTERAASSVTLTYVGPHAQEVTVPAGVHGARVEIIGGHGGKSVQPYREVEGGDGAEIKGTVPLTPGQVIAVSVAQYGGDSDFNKHPGEGGWGVGGWYGGRGGSSSRGDGAGGGGTTGFRVLATPIDVWAGGGGGAGGTGFDPSFNAGGPGGSSGGEYVADPGHNGRGAGAGAGGSGNASGFSGGSGGANGSNLGGAGGGGGAGDKGGAGGGGGGTGGGGGGGGGAGRYDVDGLHDWTLTRGTTSDGNGLVLITWIYTKS
jgi:hypothetical protein